MVILYKYYVPAESGMVTGGGPAYPWGGAGESLALKYRLKNGTNDVLTPFGQMVTAKKYFGLRLLNPFRRQGPRILLHPQRRQRHRNGYASVRELIPTESWASKTLLRGGQNAR
jgi:hypothetical protein